MATLLSDKLNDLMHDVAKDADKYYNSKAKRYIVTVLYEDMDGLIIDVPVPEVVWQFHTGFISVAIEPDYLDEFLEELAEGKDV